MNDSMIVLCLQVIFMGAENAILLDRTKWRKIDVVTNKVCTLLPALDRNCSLFPRPTSTAPHTISHPTATVSIHCYVSMCKWFGCCVCPSGVPPA